MARPRKLKNGRWQISYENKLRRVARTKRTFDTKKEAEDWLEAAKRDATDRLLGRRRRRVFGEALAKYLREESPKKASETDDITNASTLRWPIWDSEARRFVLLEETPLEDVPGVLGKWSADMREVLRRSNIPVYGHKGELLKVRIFHMRPNSAGVYCWYEQPAPEESDKPQPRALVKDEALLAHLAQLSGHGPFSSGTLRIRQLLVRRILFLAWKHWSTPSDVWLEHNIAEKIQLDAKSDPREEWLKKSADLDTLLEAAKHQPGLPDAIYGGVLIGWRRANQLLMDFRHVVFPVEKQHADGTTTIVQPGYIFKERSGVKGKKKPLVYPITPPLLALLKRRWDLRIECPDQKGVYLVFHDGKGRPLVRHKKIVGWARTLRNAGMPAKFVWHSLRHTFVSWLGEKGATSKHISELGGWTNARTVEQTYTHVDFQHLEKIATLMNPETKQ